jgi:uncharacterized RDD family membrane protein YckC
MMMSSSSRVFILQVIAIWIAAAILHAATVFASAADDDSEPVVLAASGGRHVFVVRPGGDAASGFEIMHLDAQVGPGVARTVTTVPRNPEAIAADGDRCWIVLPPFDAVRPQREVISFKIALNPTTKVWFAEPLGRFEILPILPKEPVLAGITATEDGPFAVTLPSQRTARGIIRERQSSPNDVESVTSELDESESPPEDLSWSQGAGFLIAPPERWRWTTRAMPDGFSNAVAAVVGRGGASGRTRLFVAWTDDGAVWKLSGMNESGWSTVELPLESGLRPIAIIESQGGIVIASETDDAAGGVAVDYIRSDTSQSPTALQLAKIPADRIGRPLGVVGTSMGPWLLDIDDDGIRILPVDPLSGALGASVRPVDETDESSLLQYPWTGIAMVSSLIAALLLRPLIERSPQQPALGLRPLPIPRRLAALCIDFIPGAMITVLVFKIDPGEFVESFRAGDPETALPAVFAIFVTATIAGITEVLFARSIGKMMVGGQVSALDGSRPSVVQRGLRAALKLVVLLLPPLGFLVFIDPLTRGMSELLSRTCVVVRDATPSDAEESTNGADPPPPSLDD